MEFTYENCQPNYEGFKTLGKLDDFIFQALAHMGNASNHNSWANTVLEHCAEVPHELKEKIKSINSDIHLYQEELRAIRNALKKNVESTE
ncbi:hypothetical protein [Cohnella sp. GCM10027633]|uniref:hypothetical protein n=1 Tax=unclassified Cohnella TaxID=2636738 RepID=UPI003625B86C